MTEHQSPIKSFPLLPFSKLVYDSMRWFKGIYWLGATVRIHQGAQEIEQWRKALESALCNHPVFSSYVDCHGRQYAESLVDILCGKYHCFSLRIDRDDILIEVHLSRILGDGKSIEVLIEDVLRAYQGISLEQDDYWGYLEYVEQQKQSQHYAESKAWLESEFSDESIPVRPTLDRHLWTLLPPKAGLVKIDFTDLHDKINRLAETEFLSMDGFFSLCAALAIADYCGTDSAALTWAYEGRERPEEQRIFGSLHRDIPFCIRKSKIEKQKSELIRQARNQIRSGIAHSDYPYTLTKPYTERWNYAVNVLRAGDEDAFQMQLPENVEFLPIPPLKYAYALLDVEIHEHIDSIQLWFRYSATHHKESSIKKFAALVRKYAEWLLEE